MKAQGCWCASPLQPQPLALLSSKHNPFFLCSQLTMRPRLCHGRDPCKQNIQSIVAYWGIGLYWGKMQHQVNAGSVAVVAMPVVVMPSTPSRSRTLPHACCNTTCLSLPLQARAPCHAPSLPSILPRGAEREGPPGGPCQGGRPQPRHLKAWAQRNALPRSAHVFDSSHALRHRHGASQSHGLPAPGE